MPRDAAQAGLLLAFGARVRSIRAAKGMSQAEVAHAAGLHPTYLSGIERGRRNASILSVYAIAAVREVAASDLVPNAASARRDA